MIISANDIESQVADRNASADDLQTARQIIVSESSRLCAGAVGDRARAIVLTGSMSRGETTLKRDGLIWRVLGDATFLLVSDDPLELQRVNLEQAIERALLALGVKCKIVVVTATTANLRAMRPHIYAYELRERGIVVWGDRDVLRQIPPFAAADIPQEDGWWLLCNRMIEQLEVAAKEPYLDDQSTAVRYRIAKLYLAMAACYLLAVGRYEPSYKDRAARLQELARSESSPSSNPLPLGRFSDFVARCTELKLQGNADELDDGFPRWCDAVSDAEALWRWIVARISASDFRGSRTDLLAAMRRRQSVVVRGKGWLRAALVQPLAFRRYFLKWMRLARHGSPRYLVYEAASELFFTGSAPDAVAPGELAAIAARLPLPPQSGDQHLSWSNVASLVAHNFHVLLESTRC
jgi:hypothetical protein